LKTTISEHLDKLDQAHDDNTISVLALQEDVYLQKALVNIKAKSSKKTRFSRLTTTPDTHNRFVRLPFLADLLQKRGWPRLPYYCVHDGLPDAMEYLFIKSEDQLKELWTMYSDDGTLAGYDPEKLIETFELDEANCHSEVISRSDIEPLPLKLCSPPHSVKLGNTFFVKFGKNVGNLPVVPEVLVFETAEYPMYVNLPARSAIRLTLGGNDKMPPVMIINTHLVGGRFEDPQVWGEPASKDAPFDMLRMFLSHTPENVILVGDTNLRPQCQVGRTHDSIRAVANTYRKVDVMVLDSFGRWVHKLFEDVAFDSTGEMKPEIHANAHHAWYLTDERLAELSDAELFLNNPCVANALEDTCAFGGHVDVCLWRASIDRGIRFDVYRIVRDGTPLMVKNKTTEHMYKHAGSDHFAQYIAFRW